MRLVNRSDLARYSDGELAALFREASDHLTDPHAWDASRRNALATLDNIAAVRAMRLKRLRGPAP